VGKTTIQKTFFEQANPSSLLERPLKPSRGVNSNTYSIFSTDLAIFDLAGQENNNWFSKAGRSVFNGSNIIICVFDIQNSLESIISFLINAYKLKKELNLRSCRIIALLHKTDLRSSPYVYNKLKIIQEFITIQHPLGKKFKIYDTSITRDYFYRTYCIIYNLINLIYQNSPILINEQEFQELKKELSIILTSNPKVTYNTSELIYGSETNFEEFKNHLERLVRLGFIESFDHFKFFKLTERAYYFKIGLEKEIFTNKMSLFNKNIKIIHLFLSIRENSYGFLHN
jgi:hypothetical protein